jgi:hypothetical protein
MLPTCHAVTAWVDQRDSVYYEDGLAVDVDGHAPSDVDAVTEGVAFVAVDVVDVGVGFVGGSETAEGALLIPAVMTPMVTRTPAPAAAAPTL